ncbi:COP1-interacting protein-related [Striga asiatica]|uniref:COP1-interacting protein-related n=1 Tax=Striga asiatica TaxID=4170 RepID=A0A5A7QP76_STRAF|nr:COP1-interacting protein-related [Striga asiatica]
MKQSTRLSSAVFQLTPTRTRCDLIIIANDNKEKIASGLLNPFLAHLKTAQDQIAKGGYSILLAPEKSSDAAWFTKATLERFVRFVSTPEILERVYTIENEIIQIEEGITLQRSSDAAEIVGEHNGRKPFEGNEGGKTLPVSNEEKAIVLYTPGEMLPETNGSCSPEENSRVQLLKVLEARKTVLQKEQGMAFARAVAAGFDIDCMEHLISFSNCFGALRLINFQLMASVLRNRKACSKFIDLWKSKHETGQWLNIEASEDLPARSDFCAINSSGIIINDSFKHDESNHELTSENNGKSGSTNNPAPNSEQEFQGQVPHIVFPPWPMHAPAGAHPVFPSYAPPRIPYYQTYTGSGPFLLPHHHHVEHFLSHHGPNSGYKRQSLDVSNSYTVPQTREFDGIRSSGDMTSDEEVSYSQKQNKRTGGSNKKQQPGKVVSQNINYATPREKKSNSETDSDSQPDIGRGNKYYEDVDANHQNKKRSSRNGGSQVSNDEVSTSQQDSENMHWLAFQDCLLRGSEEGANAEGMFTMERDVKMQRYKNIASENPLALSVRDRGEIGGDMTGGRIHGSASHKLRGSDDEFILSSADNGFRRENDQMDVQFNESNGRKILFRTAKEDFMVVSKGDQANFRNSFDPIAMNNNLESGTKRIDRDLNRMSDETLVVPSRLMSLDQDGGTDRTAIDIDSEIPTKSQKLGSEGNVKNVNYVANDLSLMPERETDKRSIGYAIGLEYEMQVCAHASDEKGKRKINDVRGRLSKSDKNRRSMATSDPPHKQKSGGPVRNVRPSMMSPLEDARARAERLRSYKADLQKMKKEKEEAEARRLESLKLERQKRIAARVGSNSVKPSALSHQTKQLPTKVSPTANRGSKFSDAEAGTSSPLQRSKVRIPLESSETHKTSIGSKISDGTQKPGNRLMRSLSSLSEAKREKNGVIPDSKASISRIRRLSEPKTVNKSPVTTVKARSAETVLKQKLFEGAEMNKVSAIIDLDRSKAATLPELKIKTPKTHVKTSGNNSEVKDLQNLNGVKPSAFRGNADLSASTCNTSHQIDADDNPIVEKTVLVLECERPSVPTLHPSEAKPQVRSQQLSNGIKGEKGNVTSELASLHASRSYKDETDKEPRRQKQSDHNEVKTVYSEKDPPTSANIANAENPYRAPHARVSSLEDPCTHKTEYNKAPQGSAEVVSRAEKTVRTLVPDVKTTKTVKDHAHSEKVSMKESPKGFRRLLKFGKKNHTSSIDQSIDSECTSSGVIEQEDNARKMASTSEVGTLKNLISQDEISAAGNVPQKCTYFFLLKQLGISLFSHTFGVKRVKRDKRHRIQDVQVYLHNLTSSVMTIAENAEQNFEIQIQLISFRVKTFMLNSCLSTQVVQLIELFGIGN